MSRLARTLGAIIDVCEPLTDEERRWLLAALAFAWEAGDSPPDSPPTVDDLVRSAMRDRSKTRRKAIR